MELVDQIIPFAKNHPILVLAWFGILAAIIVMTIKVMMSPVKTITNAMTIQLMNQDKAIIVDTRSNDDYKRGHITGAYNILPTDINNGSFKEIEKFKNKAVILTFEHGIGSTPAGEFLYKSGFKEVYILKDGIAGWNNENLPLVKH